MAGERICQKCSHELSPWREDVLHCSHCNLLWRWDPKSLSLVCLGYPPPPARAGEQRSGNPRDE